MMYSFNQNVLPQRALKVKGKAVPAGKQHAKEMCELDLGISHFISLVRSPIIY
jgi:hypothetical protein